MEQRGQRASQALTCHGAASATHPPLQVKTHRVADVTTRKVKYFNLGFFSFPGRGSAGRERGRRSECRCDRPVFPLFNPALLPLRLSLTSPQRLSLPLCGSHEVKKQKEIQSARLLGPPSHPVRELTPARGAAGTLAAFSWISCSRRRWRVGSAPSASTSRKGKRLHLPAQAGTCGRSLCAHTPACAQGTRGWTLSGGHKVFESKREAVISSILLTRL